MSDLTALEKRLTKLFGGKYYGTARKKDPVEFLPTGHPELDWLMGSGLPAGRVVELFGNPSGGKSTLTMHCIRAVQQAGGIAAYIDVEKAWSEYYARQCGVDTEQLLLLEPDTAEEALQFMRVTAQDPAIRLVVLDSVANLTPSAEYEREVGTSTIAAVGRMMSITMRQLVNYASNSGCTLLFINQVRAANMGGYGPSKDTPVGAALKFNASIRLEVSKKTNIESSGQVTGITSVLKAVKNKVTAPFRTVELDFYFPPEDWDEDDPQIYGLDVIGGVIKMAIRRGVIVKKGSWMSYGDKQWQGEAKVRAALLESPDLLFELQDLLLSVHKTSFSEGSLETEGECTETPDLEESLSYEDEN